MKAITLLATIPMLLAAPAALAQAEEGACQSCMAKQEQIELLEAQLKELKSEAAVAAPIVESVADVATASDATYTVVGGDSWMRIARKHDCKAADLAAINGKTLESVIHPGQVLKLPVGTSVTIAAPVVPKTYTIQEGDTYYNISRRLKISLDDLMAANPKAKATELYNGRVINLPSTTPSSTPAATSAPDASEIAAEAPAVPEPAKKIRKVMIEDKVTYEEFAAKHGTTTQRLNDLNGLDVAGTTVLAKGSELYVPAQP